MEVFKINNKIMVMIWTYRPYT